MIGPNALAYTLDIQTHGIPVTFTYLTDLHDPWTTGAGLGSGSRARCSGWGRARHALALKMRAALLGAAFYGRSMSGRPARS